MHYIINIIIINNYINLNLMPKKNMLKNAIKKKV